MYRIESKVDTSSEQYSKNRERMLRLVDEYRDRLSEVRKGGPEKAIKRHKDRGKLTARERIDKLLDRGSPFLELSPLAAFEMHKQKNGTDSAPSAGVVTGIGAINGRECLIVANDATVKGGTYFPETIRKHVRAQEIAWENNLPCVYLVDSGGVFLPLQTQVFPDRDHFGRIFYNQARMSREGIPQISVVMGSCTAGGAYVPAMSDETVIVRKQGTIFIGGPPLVKASTGVEVTGEELGGGDVHCRISGTSDHLANNDEHALQITRNIVENLGPHAKFDLNRTEPVDPYYDPEELYGIIPEDTRIPYDIREVIARLVDDSRFAEFKALHSTTVVTGFARLMGYPVGIVANNGVLFGESGRKAAHFIEMCGMRKIPLIFLQNITGFIVGKEYEHGGIARDGAKMVHAVSNVDVPKFTVVVGASHGAGNYGMCGRSYDPRLMWMWPGSKISVMGGEQAADVLVQVKQEQLERAGEPPLTPEQVEAIRKPILAEYDHDSSPYYSGARLWDEGIVEPLQTREALALGISMSLNKQIPDYRMGIFRM